VNVTIVGTGPSLLRLTQADFGPGPVIVLNSAILQVRKLDLPNEIHTMQKDGCLVPPILPERLIHSAVESPDCHADYPYRRVIDIEREFGLAWNTMSAPIAVRVAAQMGAKTVRMLAMDGAFRGGDSRRVMADGTIRRMPPHRYSIGGRQSEAEAAKCGVAIVWG
jgi:hypothetical protein